MSLLEKTTIIRYSCEERKASMNDQKLNQKAILLIIATAIVSIIVGISSGVGTNWLSDKKLELTYDSSSGALFPRQDSNIGVFSILVSNTGGKAIEECLCRMAMKDATITDLHVTGLPPSSINKNRTPDEVEVTVPFLNPGESFSVHMLVEASNEQLELSEIYVRGKGVVGKAGPILSSKKYRYLTTATVTSLITIIVAITLTVLIDKWGPRMPEQRDTFAYTLELNGFFSHAEKLRNSNREHTWWATSDNVTSYCLSDSNHDTIKRGIDVLKKIITVSQNSIMAKSSKTIINLNIAKLADAVQDQKLAKKHFEIAQGLHQKTFAERLSIDSQLAEIQEKLIG